MLKNIFIFLMDWSEVWALFIPLIILMLNHKQPAFLKPVIIYLWLALLINLAIDLIAAFRIPLHFPKWLQSNTPLYNIHSIVRFTCFSYFFSTLKQPFFNIPKRIIPILSGLFLLINFTFFENFLDTNKISGNLLSAEAYLLLVYCMLYYLAQLRSEDDLVLGPGFWVTTGLCIYVVINFFVFLFYNPMLTENVSLAINIWNVHNIAFIIFCLFISKSFYAPTQYQYRI